MKTKQLAAALLAALLTLSLAACAPAEGGDPAAASAFPGTPDADMVTLNITSEPSSLNPMRMRTTIDQSVLYHCMAGFTRLDEQDLPVADLAEDWDISEDGTVYTMRLRQGATWSNGDPVTVHDFYYSWVTQMTEGTGAIYAAFLYDNILNGAAFYRGEVDASALGLKVLDDHTLEITWSHPMSNGLFLLSQPFFLPINQKAYEEIGDQSYAQEAELMVTNGAYRVAQWVHDDHILLEKNPDYHAAAEIQIPQVKLVMIGDASTSLNAFMAGETDISALYDEQIGQVSALDESAVRSYVDGGSWYLLFNTQDPHLSNVNLRKALSLSLDVQSLLDHVINDGSVAADGLVPASIAGAGGESYAKARGSLFAYDKEAAQGYLETALQELGLAKEELALTFWGTDTTYNKNQAAYLQQQWKENLGLDVALKSVPSSALVEAETSGTFSFAVGGWGPSENDAITFLENFVTGMGSNYGRYSSSEYDALIAASRQESDAQQRQDLLIQAEQLLIDDAVVGPLYFTCSTYAVSGKLQGLVRTPFQFFNVCRATLAQ